MGTVLGCGKWRLQCSARLRARRAALQSQAGSVSPPARCPWISASLPVPTTGTLQQPDEASPLGEALSPPSLSLCHPRTQVSGPGRLGL